MKPGSILDVPTEATRRAVSTPPSTAPSSVLIEPFEFAATTLGPTSNSTDWMTKPNEPPDRIRWCQHPLTHDRGRPGRVKGAPCSYPAKYYVPDQKMFMCGLHALNYKDKQSLKRKIYEF